MQYSHQHLKTMVYGKFGGRTECIMGNWKIENRQNDFDKIIEGHYQNYVIDKLKCEIMENKHDA